MWTYSLPNFFGQFLRDWPYFDVCFGNTWLFRFATNKNCLELAYEIRDTIVSLMGRPLRSSINRDLSYIQSKLSNFNTVQMKNWKKLILTRLVINCQSLVQLSSWTAHCALLMLFISFRITDFVDYIDREFVVYIENSRALLFYSERSYSTVRRAAKTTTELRCFPFSRLLIFFTFKNVFSESRLLWGS